MAAPAPCGTADQPRRRAASAARSAVWRVAVLVCAVVAAAAEDSLLEARSCDFYEGHAYPATYGVELNVSCTSFAPPPNAAPPAAAAGLGLAAARAFPEGETIAWIPEGSHIWEATIPWPTRHAVAEACKPKPSAYAESVLAVALLVERRDPNSRFKRYVAALAQLSLPRISNAATFSSDHLAVLNATRPDLVEAFRSALRCIEASVGNITAFREAPPTRGEQLWAYAVVKSRALPLRGRLALAPVADLANHAPSDAEGPSAEVVTEDYEGTGEGHASLRSRRALSAGDEVTIAYARGAASNLELLAAYGFAVPGNPTGPRLPHDFGADVPEATADQGEGQEASCREALQSPRLHRGGPLLLEPTVERCLLDHLRRHHSDLQPFKAHARQLLAGLCAQLLGRYRDAHGAVNRLQQRGQRKRDWLMLEVANGAVQDMRLLEECVDLPSGEDQERDSDWNWPWSSSSEDSDWSWSKDEM